MLALLPTFKDDIIATLPAEDITAELQRQKQNRLARSSGPSEAASSEFPSAPGSVATTEDDRASLNSFQTGSYVHASQLAESGDGRPRKSKVQLWNDLKIMCRCHVVLNASNLSSH